MSSLSVELIDSKLTEQSLPKNCEMSTKKRFEHEYPLTKWSKRKIAAKIRTELDTKFENIKRINKTITRGAEAIKVHFIAELYCN